jgi:PAS domain S-box-containing protein
MHYSVIPKFNVKPALILTVIIFTLLLSWLVGSVTEHEIRNAFLMQTRIGANSIDVNRLKNLTGTSADLKSPDYLRLKQQMANIREVDKNLYFVYLMGVKNGKVFFYVDDRPDGHPEGSPPGSPYVEAPKEFNRVMQTGIPTVEGPSADSWGSYASGCAPVIDPETGKPIAIFAIDFVTSFWYWRIVSYAALPVGLVLILMLLIFSNLGSRRRGKLLKISEEKYRFMFDDNPQPNWIYDLETLSFLEVNEAAIIHYGYSKEEFMSMTLKDIRPVEDIPSLLEDVYRVRETFNNSGEWKHIKKNGELIFVEIISHSVIFNGRNSRHVLLHDITDRKLAEGALKRANNELEKLHNNLEEAVYSVDLIQNKIIYASVAHQAVFGYSPAEFIKNPQLWYEIIVPEDKPKVDARLPLLANGKNIIFEYRIADPNGQLRWIEAKMNPNFDENGKISRIDGIALDITLRKQIETELLESEINFRRSISESPVGIRIVSVDGDTVYANKAFLDIYEFNSLEEFTSTPAKNRYTPESYIQHQKRKEKRKKGDEESGYEISIVCKNGDMRHVKVSRKEVLWNGIKHFQVINLNITEQRNAEEELRKLSRAVEQSPDAICITNPEGIIEYVNPITIELTGYTREELSGRKTSIFSSAEKPSEGYAELWQTITAGNIWSGDLHNKKKNGDLYWESTTISPIFDNQGRITHFLAIKEDITERKLAETALNKSKEQLQKFASHLQNVREEEKVALAREIHDDLGQILVALKIDMGMLKQKVFKTNSFADSSDILPKFDNIVDLIDKTIKTTRRIMNGLRPELLEMYGFVGATKDYLREFEDRHHLRCEFECNISDLEMNQQQSLAFFRIFQEAMNNVAKHAKATLVKIQLQKQNNTLSLKIIDNGVGFDKNNQGRGDSYGMIGMKERVILLEGKLDIVSKVGQGTCVRIEMPYSLNKYKCLEQIEDSRSS